MKTLKSLTYAIFGMTTLAATLTSCQDEDFGFTAEQIAYETSFSKKFGKIKDIPTFDLSTYNLNKMGLQGGPSAVGQTRATGTSFYDRSEWFEVPKAIVDWLDDNLPEGEADNKTKAGTTDFTLGMPGNDLLLIPVYQGKAGMSWDLYIEGGTVDEKLWSKSQGIQTYGPIYTFNNDTQVGTQTYNVNHCCPINGQNN